MVVAAVAEIPVVTVLGPPSTVGCHNGQLNEVY